LRKKIVYFSFYAWALFLLNKGGALVDGSAGGAAGSTWICVV
jgi:hypothetical protein